MLVEEWKRKNPPIQRKPNTNADRIRSMMDEELADYFSELSCWPHAGREDCRGMANCFSCWLDWLKSPAEEGGADMPRRYRR